MLLSSIDKARESLRGWTGLLRFAGSPCFAGVSKREQSRKIEDDSSRTKPSIHPSSASHRQIQAVSMESNRNQSFVVLTKRLVNYGRKRSICWSAITVMFSNALVPNEAGAFCLTVRALFLLSIPLSWAVHISVCLLACLWVFESRSIWKSLTWCVRGCVCVQCIQNVFRPLQFFQFVMLFYLIHSKLNTP